jgi:peptidoglycan/LPS O-acetylase OafA/YrhL
VRSGEFRSDIEGLRAISILVVVFYHAKSPLFSGGFVGVDVFFVISGFLITGLLLREMEHYQRVDLLAFWARRARRLLPNALLVLATTLFVAAVLLPFTQREAATRDIISALLYFSNYRFAERSVDYFDQETESSPVLHFWSLSVEEQFYIVWPLLLVSLVWVFKGHNNKRAIWALSAIACASFSLSLFWMSKSQSHAFFHTEARIWQLAVGALLAAGYGRVIRLSPILHAILGWIGLTGIVASVVMFDDRIPYPGFWALIPVISTAAVIAGGSAGELSPKIVLGLAPLQWLGRRSYSVYLWHWPLMIVMPYALPGLPYANIIAIALALPIAAAAFTFWENPIRHRAKERMNHGRTLTYAVAACGILCLASSAVPRLDKVWGAQQAELIRRVSDAKADVPRMVGGRCETDWDTAETSCRFGSPDASAVVALFGDSHAEHLFDGVYEAVRSSNQVLWVLVRHACPPADVITFSANTRTPDWACSEWRDKAIRRLIAERPSLVLIASYASGVAEKLSDPHTGQRLDPATSVAWWMQGFWAVLQRLHQAGLNVIVVRDTPRSRRDNVLDCLAQSGGNACGSPRRDAVDWKMPDIEVARRFPEIGVLDLTDYFCGPHVCPAVKDGIIIYRNNNHLTASFSKTLAPEFRKILSLQR